SMKSGSKTALVIIVLIAALVGGYAYYDHANTHQITVEATDGGTAKGSGEYFTGDTVTLEATPDSKHRFDGWYDGETLLSSDKKYTFTASKSMNVTASFSILQYKIVATSTEGGTTTGTGTYDIGTTVSVTAANSYGYVFSGWYDGSTLVSSNKTLSFKASVDRTLTARFDPDYFDIKLAENYDGGSQTGSGTFAYKTTTKLTATTYSGYEFKGWSVDDKIVSTSPTYTYTVTGDETVTATYGIIHDASFKVVKSSSTAPTTVSITPTYNVEISKRVVKFDDILGSSDQSSSGSSGGTWSFKVNSYAAYNVTQTITYTDGTVSSSTQEVVVDGTETRTYSWKYQQDEWYSALTKLLGLNNKGATWDLDLSFAWYYEHLSADTPRGSTAAWNRIADYVDYKDSYIRAMATSLQKFTSDMSSLERLNCILKLVQSIDYQYDSDGKGVDDYYKYPAETLWEMKGDCEDHAILFASLAKAMGYDVILMYIYCYDSSGNLRAAHVAAGVDVDGASGTYIEYNGVKYYYCEATSSVGDNIFNYRNVGEKPDGYEVKKIIAV
ncbi:MAG: InlB B-repeat-containing protein, partial [Thermoplasmata archaeon]|nr:InlB B-repeat-containing protein [Thermoplasmata archaeon]